MNYEIQLLYNIETARKIYNFKIMRLLYNYINSKLLKNSREVATYTLRRAENYSISARRTDTGEQIDIDEAINLAFGNLMEDE